MRVFAATTPSLILCPHPLVYGIRKRRRTALTVRSSTNLQKFDIRCHIFLRYLKSNMFLRL